MSKDQDNTHALAKVFVREHKLDRWGDGIEHHPKSVEIVKFLSELDLHCYADYFCWKTGGDGDNGETLMYQLDAFFEAKDRGEI